LIFRGIINFSGHLDWRDDNGEVGWQIKYVLPLICSAIGGYAFVLSGYWTAPMGKKIVALILLVIIVLFSGIGGFAAYHYSHTEPILEAIGQLAGSVIAYLKINNNSEDVV